MTVIESVKDPEARTLTVHAEFAAEVERVWQLFADPRKLERWWGPPSWPATFEQHELVVGSFSHYFMTGPEGEKSSGWWKITAVEEPRSFRFDDGFANEDGTPNDEFPVTHAVVTLEASEIGTKLAIVSTFDSAEQLEQLVAMGMEEGLKEAMSQIDGILAEG